MTIEETYTSLARRVRLVLIAKRLKVRVLLRIDQIHRVNFPFVAFSTKTDSFFHISVEKTCGE